MSALCAREDRELPFARFQAAVTQPAGMAGARLTPLDGRFRYSVRHRWRSRCVSVVSVVRGSNGECGEVVRLDAYGITQTPT
jgi:hypothetical protein